MRKLFLSLAFLGICGLGFGQISDNAVIPVSVTINSVLRLQVTSGGNIQFVFNTIDDFTNGIENAPGTTTSFNVASSRAFDVNISTQDADLQGLTSGGTANLGLIEHLVTGGTGTLLGGGTTYTALQQTTRELVDDSPATTTSAVTYEIEWRAGKGATPATDLAPDTYVTNVYLTLVPN